MFQKRKEDPKDPLLNFIPEAVVEYVFKDYLPLPDQIRFGPALGLHVNPDVLDFRHVDKTQVTDELLACLPHGMCTRTIYLNGCTQVTDAGIESITKRCTQLTDFHLWGCTQVTDVGLQYISGCPQLKQLDLSECRLITDAGLQTIIDCCKQIELTCSYCDQITNQFWVQYVTKHHEIGSHH